MIVEEIAERLIDAGGRKEFNRVLAQADGYSDTEIAYAIKDKCYASWTKEPTEAQKAALALRLLSNLRNNKEIDFLAHWITGISEITEGKLKHALENFRIAHGGFIDLGKGHEAAQTQVAKMIPLGLLGEYERAIIVGKEALATFETLDDELAAGKIEMNLAIIAARQGQFRESRDYCIAARDRFLELRETQWILFAENDLAIALAELNEFQEAEDLYLSSLKIARRKNLDVTEAGILGGLGNLQTFRGQYGDALRYLEMSRQKYEQLDMPHQSAIADLEIAEIYQILNLTAEASDIYARVTKQLKEFKMRGEEARSRTNAGKLALLNGEHDIARIELQKAIVLFEKEDNPAGKAAAMLLQARLENEAQESKRALELVESAEALIAVGLFPRLELEALFMRGLTLQLLNRLEEAEIVFKEVVNRAKASEQLNIAATSLVSLAKIAFDRDSPENAETNLEDAVRIVESLRDPIPAEEFRMTFFADKLAPFELLSEVLLKQEKVERAFVYSERAKSRTLVEAIGGNAGPALEDSESYNRIREKLNWCYSRITRDGTSDGSYSDEIARIEKQLAELKLRESSLVPGAAFKSKISDWDRLPSQLIQKIGKNRSILEYTKRGDVFSAFVVDSVGVKHFEDIASETDVIELLEGFRFHIESMRYQKATFGDFSDQLKDTANEYLRELYERLISPFEDVLEDKNLVVVPVSSLFYVPFNALYNEEKHLIETREIVISPGSAVWNRLTDSTGIKPRKALIIAFADDSIPLVEQESVSVSGRFDDAIVLSGKDATTANYFRFSTECDVIHLACHGEFRPDNPMYSNLKLSDGFLTVRDIASSPLNAELITLSACETGLNQIFAGNEILGLARGFLSAGAKNMVMSLWTVNDVATEALMNDFYRFLSEGKSIPTALRTAQCNQIRDGFHPYFWAPFSMIGR